MLRARYGLPVDLESHRPTLVCGARVGAIDIPAQMAVPVLDALTTAATTEEISAPVIRNPRDTVWTFLIRPVGPITAAQQRHLAECGITVRARGRRVILPVTDSGFGWRWVGEPTPGRLRLPQRATILATIDRMGGADEDRRPPDHVRLRACGGGTPRR
ncbi:hypothetical protein [Nocardia shimofusensis]|uniref:hypothetical protein n=1 Tax=Nocardia shimofusensis TaxID=228596 RepID=UPI0012EDDAB7|nr:hypothetical protein [Nocardia shimofusensis]